MSDSSFMSNLLQSSYLNNGNATPLKRAAEKANKDPYTIFSSGDNGTVADELGAADALTGGKDSVSKYDLWRSGSEKLKQLPGDTPDSSIYAIANAASGSDKDDAAVSREGLAATMDVINTKYKGNTALFANDWSSPTNRDTINGWIQQSRSKVDEFEQQALAKPDTEQAEPDTRYRGTITVEELPPPPGYSSADKTQKKPAAKADSDPNSIANDKGNHKPYKDMTCEEKQKFDKKLEEWNKLADQGVKSGYWSTAEADKRRQSILNGQRDIDASTAILKKKTDKSSNCSAQPAVPSATPAAGTVDRATAIKKADDLETVAKQKEEAAKKYAPNARGSVVEQARSEARAARKAADDARAAVPPDPAAVKKADDLEAIAKQKEEAAKKYAPNARGAQVEQARSEARAARKAADDARAAVSPQKAETPWYKKLFGIS